MNKHDDMKRIFGLLLAAAFAFAAVSCDPANTDPTPQPGNTDPLVNCVIPESVKAGGQAQIQWDGFKQNASILLVGQSADEHVMDVKVVTAYGLTFKVPVNTPEGLYDVVLVQDGRTVLGKITVTPADMPVTGLKVPAGAQQGESFIIEGIGFENGCSVIAVDKDGAEHTLATEVSYQGLTVTIPADLAEGDYALYLLQDEMRWLLASSFSVYKELVVKTLVRIDYYTEYVDDALLKLSWEISREEPATLTVSQSIVEDGVETLDVYDMYQFDNEGVLALVTDGFEDSNDLEMSYAPDEEGNVSVSYVLIYGKQEPTPFTWTYDMEGFLTSVASPTAIFRSFEYQNGNMTVFNNTSFEYGDASLVNNPAAPDVIWGYMSLLEKNDPFMYVPYFLGWYTKASAQLPTVMLSPSPTGTGTDRIPLSYDFDEDGYVVRMTIGSDWVEYGFTSASN